jgi:hypothetical protein
MFYNKIAVSVTYMAVGVPIVIESVPIARATLLTGYVLDKAGTAVEL